MNGPWGRLPLFETPAAPAAGKEAARAPGQFHIGAPGQSEPPAAAAEEDLEAGCSAAASFSAPSPQAEQAEEQDPAQGVFAWSPVVSRAELRQLSTSAELASGPHLRAFVVVFCAVLWLAVREWAPKFTMVPLVGLLCTSTSALWCMPNELVISLGPVPACFFRRRIAYEDIQHVAVVRGRLRILQAFAQRVLKPWQPLGGLYGLTLGKAVIEVSLKAKQPVDGDARRARCSHDVYLISVDEADDIVDHILFRREHGPLAPLPARLVAAPPPSDGIRWVVCDLIDMLLSWHARNGAVCDIFNVLLQLGPEGQEAQGYKYGHPVERGHMRTA